MKGKYAGKSHAHQDMKKEWKKVGEYLADELSEAYGTCPHDRYNWFNPKHRNCEGCKDTLKECWIDYANDKVRHDSD